MSSTARPYDIVVHGATGYTGRLVSQYLASSPSSANVKWAICGRSKAKLDELVGLVSNKSANWHKSSSTTFNIPEVLVADSTKQADMMNLVTSTKLVIACAGPFSAVGKDLVAACVAAGTHYVDITGEFPFVREVIEAHHETAVAKKIFVVPSCGFDCVPSDLSNAFAFDLAASNGVTIRRVEAAFRIKGGAGPSRGTLESVLNIKNAIRRKDFEQLSLVSEKDREGIVAAAPVKRPRWSAGFNAWMGPFFMSAMNERLVLRSNSLIAERRTATYIESVTGTFLAAVIYTLVSLLFVALFIPGVAPVLRRFVFPAAGQGPSSLKGSYIVSVAGYVSATAALPAVQGQMRCSIPAYPFTAVSVSETALAILAKETVAASGGVLTSYTAVGPALKRRLVESGYVTFTDSRK